MEGLQNASFPYYSVQTALLSIDAMQYSPQSTVALVSHRQPVLLSRTVSVRSVGRRHFSPPQTVSLYTSFSRKHRQVFVFPFPIRHTIFRFSLSLFQNPRAQCPSGGSKWHRAATACPNSVSSFCLRCNEFDNIRTMFIEVSQVMRVR